MVLRKELSDRLWRFQEELRKASERLNQDSLDVEAIIEVNEELERLPISLTVLMMDVRLGLMDYAIGELKRMNGGNVVNPPSHIDDLPF